MNRLPTVTNISFAQGVGNQLLKNLLKVVAVSSGSACSSASPEPSHVLKAMGLDDAAAYHAIRFSLGKYNTEEEVEFVIQRVRLALEEMKSEMVHIHDGIENLNFEDFISDFSIFRGLHLLLIIEKSNQ